MKNYKLLVPAVLVALFVLGIYMVGAKNAKEERQFAGYLADARRFAAQKIELYAKENYQKALEMRPSLELYLEIAGFYRDMMEALDKAAEWGEAAVSAYPKSPEAYAFLLQVHLDTQDYMSFFALYDEMHKRRVASQRADALYESVEYEYYMEGEYDNVSVFSSNLAPVCRNGDWGYCNSKGRKKIGTVYAYAGAFNNGMAPVMDGEGNAFYIDQEGNKVFVADMAERVMGLGTMSASDIYAVNNGREWNFYDKSDNLIMGGFWDASAMANGLAACRTKEGWKIYDTSGSVAIDAVYDEVLTDEKGMAYRNDRLFVRIGDFYRMIDGSGNQISPESYEDAKIFYEATYAAVKKGGKWGFVDKDGNWFIEPAYEDARSFFNGYAAVRTEGRWGFVNMDKELCIPCRFSEAKDFTANGTVLVQQDLAWSVLLLYQKNY